MPLNQQELSTVQALAARFPKDFVWGVATAAYQIEGAATEAGRGPSIWDTFAHTPGRTRNGETGDTACDHYHRWREDFDLLSALGVPAYRLSLSWSRLQPGGNGPLNPEALTFYRNLLEGLSARGIEPYVTLYHWDMPQELESEGGWVSRQTAERFADYTARVVGELGGLAQNWMTLNEPWCSSYLGYGTGAHAPGRRNLRDAVAAGHHLNLAHGLALARIRALRPELKVGIVNLITDIVPRSDNADDRAAAARLDAASNRFFLDPVYAGGYPAELHALYDAYGLSEIIVEGDLALIGAPTDFIGVNHYQRVVAWADDAIGPFGLGERPAEPATTSFGWSVLPDSLSSVLERVARDYTDLPIYVTENGASFDDRIEADGHVNDVERVDYLARYLDAAAKTRARGIDLRGYFLWSFLDNFEWAEGYSKRFGIVHVDYATQTRTPKLSARWYAALIAAHAGRAQ